MSVEVKTPTRIALEHKDFPFGTKASPTVTVTVTATGTDVSRNTENEGVNGSGETSVDGPVFSHPDQGSVDGKSSQNRNSAKHDKNANQHGKPGFYRFESAPGGRPLRKRRHSERIPGDHPSRHEKSLQYKRGRFGKFRGTERIVLPTKFLLGGNITDPLNLNSLCDDEVNKALNEKTPQSSPLPIPAHRKQVEVLIPPNITDPLNLNSGEEVDLNLLSPKCKKKRNQRHKKKRSLDASKSEDSGTGDQLTDYTKPVHIDVNSEAAIIASTSTTTQNNDAQAESQQPVGNKIRKVIDKIVSPVIPQTSPKSWRKKRTISEGRSEGSSLPRAILNAEESSEKLVTSEKVSPIRPKYRRQGSSLHSQQQTTKTSQQRQQRFIYGNYNRYYGYRNPDQHHDERLRCFQIEWFDRKDVLDIGCNVGHVTLSIARDFSPRKIIGIDIDSYLIKAAKNNIRHYLSSQKTDTSKFPASMVKMFGPIAAPPVVENKDKDENVFPANVHFIQGNYVLEQDELLDLQREEYDVILALSLTKWIHLNYGDDGLKRTFKRIFRQLRPGGRLILEPQSWFSYKKKKKLTDRIFKNYQSICLRPEQFTEYLLSREVGFSTCMALKLPFNKIKGFQRPLQVFTKADTAYVTPIPEPWSAGTTPVLRPFEDSRDNTPKFVVGSGPGTPNMGWSAMSSRSQSPADSSSTAGTTPNQTSGLGTLAQEVTSESSSPRPLSELKCCSAPSLLETCSFNTVVRSKSILCSSICMEEDSSVELIKPDNSIQQVENVHGSSTVSNMQNERDSEKDSNNKTMESSETLDSKQEDQKNL